MQIIPDPFFAAIMTLPFFVSMVSLYVFLLRPLQAYLDGRDGAIHGARAEAEELASAAEAKIGQLEQSLAAARAAASQAKAEIKSRAQADEAAVLDAARGEAEAKLDEALAEIAAQSVEARTTLKDTATALSGQIATSVLGRPLDA